MTSPLRICFTFLTALSGLLLAGCNVGPIELSGLVVQADGIRSFEQSGGQADMVVTMRVHNETIRPIGIRGMRLELTLNGIKVGTINDTKPVATQALSSNTLDVTFTIADAATAARLKDALRTGALNYDLKARVTVFSGENEMRSTSTSNGSIQVNPHLLNLDD